MPSLRKYGEDVWDIRDFLRSNGNMKGIKLPVKCGRCEVSYFNEGSGLRWYWIDGEKESQYTCESCLTPEEEELFNCSNHVFTFLI